MEATATVQPAARFPGIRQLPSRLYEARTLHVFTPDIIMAEIDLGFGSLVRRKIRVEGVDRRQPPGVMGEAALHCMAVLLGGKKLVLQIASFPVEGEVYARVFLDEDIYGHVPGLAMPIGLDELMLDAGEFYQHLGRNHFNVGLVKSAFNQRALGRGDTRRLPTGYAEIKRKAVAANV